MPEAAAQWRRVQERMAAGQFDAAQFECARLVGEHPRHVLGCALLANLLLRNGQLRAATRYALQAGEGLAAGSDWQAASAAAAILAQLGEDEAALAALRGIDVETLADPRALVHLGRQFSDLQEQAAAVACLGRARERGLDDALVRHLEGMALTFTGPLAAAAEALEAAVALEPGYGHALWSLSQLDLADGAGERIARLHAAEAVPGRDPAQAQYVQFALFHEYDRLDRREEAWRHLTAACERRRRLVAHDSARETRLYDALIEAATGLQAAEQPATPGALPVFIVGLPRTGTTLLERILGNFPQIRACGELETFRQQLQWVADAPMAPPIDEAMVDRLRGLDLSLLGQRFLEKSRWRAGEHEFYVDKHPVNANYAGLIALALPQARLLHIRRNPMDSCFSNLKQFYGPQHYTWSYRQDELATHYRNHDRLMRHWQALVPGRILELRYEDLVADPVGQAERVRRFCGLRESGDVTDIQANRRVSSTASTVQVRQPIHRRFVQAWRRYQPQLQPLQAALADLQAEYDSAYPAEPPPSIAGTTHA
jgi:hypothetical protein